MSTATSLHEVGEVISIDAAKRGPAVAESGRPSPRALSATALALLVALGGIGWILAPGRSESTDDAYVGANTTTVAPKVRGLVADVLVTDNQAVHAGDALVDRADRRRRWQPPGAAGRLRAAGTRLLTLVPLQALYVTANFKETQTARMHVGQRASVQVDALSLHPLAGVVESLAPGSGSQFALLPFEPGTGNFTKIVQHVPVRIRFDASQPDVARLRPGLSVTAKVMLQAP